jgi:hypothetical protein
MDAINTQTGKNMNTNCRECNRLRREWEDALWSHAEIRGRIPAAMSDTMRALGYPASNRLPKTVALGSLGDHARSSNRRHGSDAERARLLAGNV